MNFVVILDMALSNLKLEFAPLCLNGDNYMSWANDVLTNLKCEGLENIISEVYNAEAEIAAEVSMKRAKSLKLMKQHLDEGLKLEYMNVQDPKILWDNLKERFGYQKKVLLPALIDEWNKLRFQDFKSVIEYNSAMYRIISQLEFCGKIVSEGEKLEKTYATFHASHLVLQEQYRMRGYTKYSDLIAALLLAEKNNELLMKNHHSRPTGAMAFPEINATRYNQGRGGYSRFRGRGEGRGRGRGRGHFRGRGRGRGFGNYYRPARNDTMNINRPDQGKSIQEGSSRVSEESCYRCGKKGHWSKACRTPYYLCKNYKAPVQGKGKEVNFNDHEPEDDSTYLEAADFVEGPSNVDIE